MGRARALDPCIFCGDAPCSCNKPAKKASKPKRKSQAEPKPKAEKPEAESVIDTPVKPKVGAFAAMKAKAKPIEKPEPEQEQVAKPERNKEAEDDPQFRKAIKALESMMHPTEKRRFAHILETTETLEERKRRWRQQEKWKASWLEHIDSLKGGR